MRRNIHYPTALSQEDFFSKQTAFDRIITLLNFAVLAPSTHNTQPWKFKIGANSCKILIDNSRQLPAADPLKRDMYISLGALIKNLEVAAKAFSVYARTHLTNQSSDLVAEVYFQDLLKSKKVIPEHRSTLEAIKTRTNYRGPLKPVKPLQNIRQMLQEQRDSGIQTILVEDNNKVRELGKLTAHALRRAYATPNFRQEIGSWSIPNSSQKKKGIPGYSLRMPMLASHIIPKIIRRKDIGAKLAERNYQSFITASAVVVLASEKEDPVVWINVGQKAQQIFLALEQQGIVCSIFVAAIEMPDSNKRIEETLKLLPKLKAQFLFCLGKPVLPKVYSPRETVKTKLIS